jgi:hypothetical protein
VLVGKKKVATGWSRRRKVERENSRREKEIRGALSQGFVLH